MKNKYITKIVFIVIAFSIAIFLSLNAVSSFLQKRIKDAIDVFNEIRIVNFAYSSLHTSVNFDGFKITIGNPEFSSGANKERAVKSNYLVLKTNFLLNKINITSADYSFSLMGNEGKNIVKHIKFNDKHEFNITFNDKFYLVKKQPSLKEVIFDIKDFSYADNGYNLYLNDSITDSSNGNNFNFKRQYNLDTVETNYEIYSNYEKFMNDASKKSTVNIKSKYDIITGINKSDNIELRTFNIKSLEIISDTSKLLASGRINLALKNVAPTGSLKIDITNFKDFIHNISIIGTLTKEQKFINIARKVAGVNEDVNDISFEIFYDKNHQLNFGKLATQELLMLIILPHDK